MSEIWSCFFRELRGRQELSERTMKERVTRDAGKKGVLEQKKKEDPGESLEGRDSGLYIEMS